MTAGKLVTIVTGTATVCVFDPALVRHKLEFVPDARSSNAFGDLVRI